MVRKIELTVLLASLNGEDVLPRTLDGYVAAQAPPVGWKMVFVDNGSTDRTPEIVASFRDKLPLEVIAHQTPGKNSALNAGLAAIEGRLTILTDDDTIPAPDFLTAWTAYLDSREDCGLFGGSIEPLFEKPAPNWMLESPHHSALMFGTRDLPEGPTTPGHIYGGNMAVRAAVFDRGFRFAEEISPTPLDPDYPMGSETEFCRRVASARVGCWFAERPRVFHIVRPWQLSLAAWKRRAYRSGRGRAYQMWKRGDLLAAPIPSLAERLGVFSPVVKHRFHAACASELARGFHDECARYLATAQACTHSDCVIDQATAPLAITAAVTTSGSIS